LRRIRRPDRLYLAGALLILVFITILSFQDWNTFGSTALEVDQTRQILQHTESLLSAVKDAETGQRGFVITGDDQYLDPYNSAVAALPSELSQLRALSANRPTVRPRIDALEVLVREKLEELNDTILLRRKQGFQAALEVIKTDRGKKTMDEIRRVGGEIENEVYTRLMIESRQWQQEGQRTQLTMALGAGILFCFLLLATFDIGKAAAERDRLIVDLQLANARTGAGRDLLQTTLASIGDAVIATDSSAKITFLNPIAEALTGWKQAEAAGQPLDSVFKIVNERTRAAVENPAAKVLREGTVVGLANHTVLIARDGSERPIDDSGAPIRNAQGETIGVVMVFRDITGRRATENALRESEQRLRLALEAGEIGIWDWDVMQNRIAWSERMYALHGIEPDAFAGKIEDLTQLVHPDDRALLEASVQRSLREREPHRLEFRVVHPDGGVRWLATSARAHYDEEGNPVRMLGAVNDMTERKKSEQQLRLLNQTLRRINQDLQQFSYAASHDLKEPLRTVSNYLQLLRNRHSGQLLGQEALELLQVAIAGAQRMHSLVEALLEYSRAGEVGASTIEPVVVEQAVHDALTNLQASIGETGASVSIGPLPTVTANRLHLTQVFQNLISNALKYRSAKPPRISISASDQHEEWQFLVEDNGVGIAPEYRSQIFGIFKRLHGNEYPGAGIGLATCKKIVGRYGGRIWVESEPGKGSTFFFTIPKTSNIAADAAGA
jgi:PAS domain S-box-containing protein